MDNEVLNSVVPSQPDRSLVLRIRDGDDYAASVLYDRYARRLFGLIRTKMNGPAKAGSEPEDIVQSVFRSVFCRMKNGSYNAPEGSTLWSLLAVVATHKLHKNTTYRTAQCRDVGRNVSLDAANTESLDDGDTVLIELCVRETLKMLTPLEQQVLTLRLEGHSIEEIAVILERGKRTIERCFEKMRTRFADHLLQDEDEAEGDPTAAATD